MTRFIFCLFFGLKYVLGMVITMRFLDVDNGMFYIKRNFSLLLLWSVDVLSV